jgi:2-polyprenyl-3-methyl-5-hydroxy-6-metoxy-1,4-benzoquinol methylase
MKSKREETMRSAAAQGSTIGSATVIQCPECAGINVQDKGFLPKCRKFAGQTLSESFAGGRLYKCTECDLVFRYPSLNMKQYEALYEGSYNHYWSSDTLRFDQQLIRDEIHRLLPEEGGKVLDIGCYDGALLASLGPRIEKFGIEPSSKAAEVARQAGIEIVGSTLADLKSMEAQFDVICGVNVIEHVHSPIEMLKLMAERVKPGGHLIISTGDASSLAWRTLGPSYWYSANPEHISFICPAWCEKASKKIGIAVKQIVKFRYEPLPPSKHVLFWGELAFKTSLATLEKTVIRAVSKKARQLSPRLGLGRQGMFKDHIYAIFSKPQ